MNKIDRREFVIATGIACGCAVCGIGLEVDEALAQGSKAIDAGAPTDYPADGVSDKLLRQKILIVRSGKRIHAMSAVCSHKACTVRVRDKQVKCPCHGSAFSEQGTPVGGPAKRALVRYGVKLSDSGRIMVDKSQQFPEQKWEDKGSFIEIV